MALKLKKRSAKKAADAPVKGRPPSATRGTKFVLFIGDEGAILVHIKGNTVQNRQFVPGAEQHHLNEFRQTLAQDPQAPLMLVVDSMDQAYMQQTLPPVSSLSVNKLIKRRLERDFGPDDIKGAVLLGREKSGRKDWNFLMVSLERSPQLTAWLDFLEEMPNRFRGIYLVSVETEILIKNLERAMGLPKEGTGAEWKFFVSHNKVGGFRQVVLRNGRIIFTRLAQPVGESNKEVIAGSIEQEMLSTIEYMKRLGFNAQDGLDIYIVASAGIKEAIDRSKFNVTSLQVMTPFDLAQYLNIQGASQPSDQFGDVILAAAIGCTRKHILTLSTPRSRQIDTYYQLVSYQRLAAGLIGLSLIGYAGMTAYEIYSLSSSIEDLTRKKSVSQQNLDQLQSEVGKSQIDLEKTDDLIDLYQQITTDTPSPVPMISKLRLIVQPPVKIKGLVWQLGGGETAAAPVRRGGGAMPTSLAAAFEPNAKTMSAVVTLEFPAEANNPKVFRVMSQKVLSDFKAAFPAPYEVDYATIPARFLEQEKMEIDFAGEDKSQKTAELPEVQINIKGEIVTDAVATSPALIPAQ